MTSSPGAGHDDQGGARRVGRAGHRPRRSASSAGRCRTQRGPTMRPSASASAAVTWRWRCRGAGRPSRWCARGEWTRARARPPRPGAAAARAAARSGPSAVAQFQQSRCLTSNSRSTAAADLEGELRRRRRPHGSSGRWRRSASRIAARDSVVAHARAARPVTPAAPAGSGRSSNVVHEADQVRGRGRRAAARTTNRRSPTTTMLSARRGAAGGADRGDAPDRARIAAGCRPAGRQRSRSARRPPGSRRAWPVAGLEDVERERRAREEDDVEREEREPRGHAEI